MSKILEKIVEIETLESGVRKHINTSRYQDDLIKDKDNWSQICSSLDTIGDTLYAIGDYLDADYPEKVGLKYISTYGILQALFIQQDAIKHLSEAFGIAYSHAEILWEIRRIRHSTVGHPTKQNRDTPDGHTYYNHISRMTLSKTGFQLMQSFAQGKHKFVDVDLYSLIEKQLGEISVSYEQIADKLNEADRMHKEKFKDQLLIDNFSSGMGYFFEKVAQGIHAQNNSDVRFGLKMLQLIAETYQKFEEALKNRGELNTYIQHDLDEYKHAIGKLQEFLSGTTEDITDKDAYIYHYYLYEKNKHFEQVAREIDDSYEEQ